MAGERELGRLLAGMRPVVREGTYVFVALPAGRAVPAGVEAVMEFREAEGVTLIVRQEEAAKAGLEGVFACRMITLTVHSALEAVGFLAAVTARLAAAGMGVNAVSAFYHDSLFVPADRAEEAVRILEELAREAEKEQCR